MKKRLLLALVVVFLTVGMNSIMAIEKDRYYDYAEQVVASHLKSQIENGLVDLGDDSVFLGESIILYNEDLNEEYIYFPIITDRVIATLRISEIDSNLYSTMSSELVEKLNNDTLKNVGFRLYSKNGKIDIEKNQEFMLRNSDLFTLYKKTSNNFNYIKKYKEIRLSDETTGLRTYLRYDRYPSSKILNISGVRQQKETCWAAVAATNINYIKGTKLDDFDIIKIVKGDKPSSYGGDMEDSIFAYSYYGIDSNGTRGNIYQDEVKYYINEYKPVDIGLKRYKYNDEDGIYGRHAVSLYGYSSYDDGDLIYRLWDPARGTATVDVDNRGNFVYGTGNGTYLWEETITLR